MGQSRTIEEEIVEVCRNLCARGLIAGTEGNVSVRLDDDALLITPAGVTKRTVEAGQLVRVNLDGQPLVATQRPSSELAMHLRIYRRRADVRAVVHAHPPVATAFGLVGEALAEPVLPEVVLSIGPVALVPYGTPGTDALPDQMEPFLATHDAFILANHGATSLGPSLRVASARMESLEHSARILLAARLLGRVRPLTPDQVRDLVATRDGAGPTASSGSGAPRAGGLENE